MVPDILAVIFSSRRMFFDVRSQCTMGGRKLCRKLIPFAMSAWIGQRCANLRVS